MNNKNMPAMPLNPTQAADLDAYIGFPDRFGIPTGLGITKREHFAGLAMQGLCHAVDSQGTWAHDAKTVAETAIRYADALLAELDMDNP
jgi:hypothetical protein